MNMPTTDDLRTKKCVPCEGGVPTITPDQAAEYLKATPQWSLDETGKAIYRKIHCKHFVEAMSVLNRVAEVAEKEQHHPDLHLTGYRKVRIDLTTHAIDGLSENDFIVAAKIDEVIS
jgi:4a-hydroxytetrahydrobiopterin dehydratase